ncbi:MAG: CRISPR-associated endonuclease Cas2 [Spirochaetes bacterium GWF1_31_7]|nr:MAG: CRISPR-associated endonuclease Cas2 [Spirochaetes bacterium GWE1_32_154]OHD46343.1 MAG: CRISPR-associated endonuclease Cas2 [Spirochaetes bacterium GWE2_31_10]OHD52575.1 MAG: CRISPR-associated endonuclease Cas2 [Spirochaetes bacterium GWF1_31_7]OHD83385.1 MAG: CRISPR-associated endonuclease Cas2 [Spirochaetes bacterium RIFOXYB1_FULL_32_8]HBD93453.1 CRISPR-associated endonuclease Cas2 [Spirochaetia bacterium]
MLTWFIYDITSDKARTKIAKLALRCGLYRVQKSVFLGQADHSRVDEIVIQSEQLIDPATDSLYVFPMCEKDFKSVVLKGQAFDKAMVNDEIKALFL